MVFTCWKALKITHGTPTEIITGLMIGMARSTTIRELVVKSAFLSAACYVGVGYSMYSTFTLW